MLVHPPPSVEGERGRFELRRCAGAGAQPAMTAPTVVAARDDRADADHLRCCGNCQGSDALVRTMRGPWTDDDSSGRQLQVWAWPRAAQLVLCPLARRVG